MKGKLVIKELGNKKNNLRLEKSLYNEYVGNSGCWILDTGFYSLLDCQP